MEVGEGFEVVPPSASAMVESMRAYGYSPGTAVADLVDNSIAAGARNVWLRFIWDGPDSCISVTDDGIGMDEDGLRNAMRLGSRSPLEDRHKDDLGRFGLGLKTASFSQSRRLTVASIMSGGAVATRCWDLDHIARSGTDRWELRTAPMASSERHLQALDSMKSGTVVLWELLDRLVAGTSVGNDADRVAFYRAADLVREHLAMVFHRYIDGPSPRLTIHTGGEKITDQVRGWDPFLTAHPATHEGPTEDIICPGGQFSVTGFILPHKDRLTERAYEEGAGTNGWTGHQGMYVYRNERLLVPGGWLGLGRPRAWTAQAHYNLARIRVDLPNTLDADWQIDVRKSMARVPLGSRERLFELAEIVRGQARKVFAHRARHGARRETEEIVRAWSARPTPDGRSTYRVNRKHPTVRALLAGEAEGKAAIERLLRTLEETVPVRQIWLDTVDQEGEHGRPFENVADSSVRDLMQATYRIYRKRKGLSDSEAVRQVLLHEEFQDFPGIAATLGE
jgi:hypothetical protein